MEQGLANQSGDPEDKERLELARRLVDSLESGESEDAASAIAQLAGFRDSLLFQEVGRLTRELHDSINSFVLDAKIVSIASTDMPDAAERLSYVMKMTEEAANTTLTAVEEALPVADQLEKNATNLSQQWKQFNDRQMTVDDFRKMSSELSNFLSESEQQSTLLHSKLNEVLMAQGYQDLTGQIIGKVIVLVEDVESKLVELIRLSGVASEPEKQEEKPAEKDISAQGPMVPGVDNKVDAVNSQDEVDDLLSSLGF